MNQFHGDDCDAIGQWKLHFPHLRRCLHIGSQKRGKVRGPDRTVNHAKSTAVFYLMGSDTGRTKLRNNKRSVRDDFSQAVCPDAPHDFIGAERPFPGRAPYVDAFGVEHKQPCVNSSQLRPQAVEAQFVVGRDEHW